jgi:hypothetical protein
MRSIVSLVFVMAGCASEPAIACSTDEQCLAGQHCSSGWCAAAIASSMMPDADTSRADASSRDPDAALPDAPPSCSPSCSGTTPYCVDGTCVQCTSALQCPLTAPRCIDNACTL